MNTAEIDQGWEKTYSRLNRFHYRLSWPVVEGLMGVRPLHYWLLGKQAGIQEGNKVLELGSNYPFWLMFAHRVGKSGLFVALDSDSWIQRASNRFTGWLPGDYMKNKFLIAGDAQNIPFADNSFDMVITSNLIAPRYHGEAYRVLKPGGRIVSSWAELFPHQDEVNIDVRKCKQAGFRNIKFKMGTPGFFIPLVWNNVFQAVKPQD